MCEVFNSTDFEKVKKPQKETEYNDHVNERNNTAFESTSGYKNY